MTTASEILVEVQQLRDEVVVFRNETSTLKSQTQAAKAQASAAASTAETHKSGALQAQVSAEAAEDTITSLRDATVIARNEAVTAKTTVLTKASEVATHWGDVLLASSNAADYTLKASQWANYPRDQVVPGETSYSARHWAEAAEEAASGVTGDILFLGSWDAAVDGTPPTPSQAVRYLIVSDGIVDGKSVVEGDYIVYDVNAGSWIVTSNTGSIASVNGYTSGNITLDYGDFAGTQHIVLDNAVQIQGRTTTTGTYAIGRVGSDNRVRLGDENSAGLALQSPNEPYWTDGVTSRTLVHAGGGQTIGGVNFTGSVSMTNNFGYYGKKSDGSWSLVGMVDSANRTRFGNSTLQTRIDSLAAPQFYNGTATYDLIHSGGGQSIASDLIVGSARLKFTGATAFTPSNGTQKTWAIVENLNGTENLGFAMRGDDATDRMSFFTDYNSSGTFTERMTIMASNGRVGINNTAPGYQLDVNGDGYFGGGLTVIGSGTIGGTNFNGGWLKIGNATTGWAFDSNEIYSTGTASIGTLAGNLSLTPVGNLVINGAATTVNNDMTVNGYINTNNRLNVTKSGSGSGLLHLQTGTGGYYIGHWNSGTNLRIEQTTDTGTWEKSWITANRNAGVNLCYDGAVKAGTRSTGFNISGTLDVATVAATSTITSQGVITSTTYGNSHIGYGTGNAASTYLTHGTGGTFYVRTYDGTTYSNALTVNGAGSTTFSGNATVDGILYANNHVVLPDNMEVRIGSGAAGLRMNHNGSNGYINNYTGAMYVQNQATGGELILRGKSTGGTVHTALQVQADGSVYARGFWDGGEKFRTVSTGLQVYGTLAADTDVTAPKINGVSKDNYIWGAGGSATLQLSSSWDEPAKSGFYDGDAKTNAPTASGWYWGLFASHSNAGTYGWSLVTNNSTDPTLYLRGKAVGAWGSWKKVVVQDASGNATIDNELYLNGTTVSGDGKEMIKYNDSWLRLNNSGSFTSGVFCGSVGVLRHDGGMQIGVGRSVLSHNGAYTSGQVYFSTAAPSGGSNGDIWYQYS